MNHVRVATYDVRQGLAAQVAELVQSPGGMVEEFRAQPGFRAYSMLEIDPVTYISLSIWETHEEAENAVGAAATWAATHLGSRIHRTENLVGDALFWDGAAADSDTATSSSDAGSAKVNHVRYATFEVTDGVVAQVAEAVSTPGGMREIWRNQPGFRAYSLIEVDPITFISLSVWDSHDAAELAVRQGAEWVATHLNDRIHRTSNFVGDALFWEGVGAASAS